MNPRKPGSSRAGEAEHHSVAIVSRTTRGGRSLPPEWISRKHGTACRHHDGPAGACASPPGAALRLTSKPPQYAGAGVAGGVLALLLMAAVILIVVPQNAERVKFDFLWWSVVVPLAVALLATGLATVATDQLIGVIWRRRRTMRELTQAHPGQP